MAASAVAAAIAVVVLPLVAANVHGPVVPVQLGAPPAPPAVVLLQIGAAVAVTPVPKFGVSMSPYTPAAPLLVTVMVYTTGLLEPPPLVTTLPTVTAGGVGLHTLLVWVPALPPGTNVAVLLRPVLVVLPGVAVSQPAPLPAGITLPGTTVKVTAMV